MESEIAVDSPLDYVTFQILPENRYGGCIFSGEKQEIVGDGPLEQLLEHLPSIKDQIINGSCDNFKLELPNSIEDKAWFTKATLTRFLHVIGSCDGLKKCIAVSNELSQLEETRKFHLSLYNQADKVTSSDNSNARNELLRAMDSRIAALTEELVSTFNMTAGATFSVKEMIALQEFSQHFGDVDIRNMFLKLSERTQKDQSTVPMNNKKSPILSISKDDYENKSSEILGQSTPLTPVQYNASPAKAAELERQSSSGSDDSSFSSEDDRPSAAERSRTLVRSASPRRSASPMRKVQIGKSGSRRTPALTIKSLPIFPAREKISSYRDTNEDSEETTKKTEINATRMSVQDAISLFERKQKDQIVDSQKNSATDNSTNTTKAVLRRWSSGMSESQKSMSHDTTEHTASEYNAEDEDVYRSAEVKLDAVPASENYDMEDNIVSEGSNNVAPDPSEDERPVCQAEDTGEKLDSAEWNRKKEEELNKMLMKFAQYNMSNSGKNTEPDNNKKRAPRLRQSGLKSNHKEKRDENFTEEKTVKRVEKQRGVRANQRVPDKPKPEKTSVRATDVAKKLPASRTPNVSKNSLVSSNSKKEFTKPAVPKKAPSTKPSPLSATRKSWPSTPSPRVTGTLPTKSPTTTSSVTSLPRQKSQSPAPRQKPQSPGPVPRPSPKLEKPQPEQKDARKQPIGTKKSLKKVDDSKSRVVPKSEKTMKIKISMADPEENAATAAVSPAKAVVRKKLAKKSSVVPLEVKPSVRKVPEICPAKNHSQKKEIPPQAEEALSRSEDSITIAENVETLTSDSIHPVESLELEAEDGIALKMETETEKTENGNEKKISVAALTQGDEVGEGLPESPENVEVQLAKESVISPAAWEESDQQETSVPIDDSSASTLVNPAAVASSETRVRHSLSQMLLEETSEPDIIEWGNAEHPPSMVYQKDAPKGLKRLLKFARKNKETNGAAWASPYTSEGEDDGDEYRNLGKRNSHNLLKVALHSNYAEGFLSDSEPHSARSNASNNSTRSSNKFQEGQASSKGARSFFSLSAFRGKN